MIEIFLNVERLSAGQMELKRESFRVRPNWWTPALERARPLADRKQIRILVEPLDGGMTLTGDRELMEYAVYNLLTNAVKYSPRETTVTVTRVRCTAGACASPCRTRASAWIRRRSSRSSRSFTGPERAEESGEAGTGIGLSIVRADRDSPRRLASK